MTTILASTRSAFFDSYEGFQPRPQASLYTEFRRLATSRGWKQGSNSKVFEKAWHRCFGRDIPVGHNIDLVNRPGPQDSLDDEDEFSLLLKLQDLNIEETASTSIRKSRVVAEFTSHYGADVSKLEKWQDVCEDCGVHPVPTSIKQCKKVLKGVSINIYHLLEAKKEGRVPDRFSSKSDLIKYLKQHPAKRYPLSLAKANGFLTALLVQCW